MLERHKSRTYFLPQTKPFYTQMPALPFLSKVTSKMYVNYGDGYSQVYAQVKLEVFSTRY